MKFLANCATGFWTLLIAMIVGPVGFHAPLIAQDMSPSEVATAVREHCSDKPTKIFELSIEQDLLSSAISSDGKKLAYLTDDAVHVLDIESGKEVSFDIELSKPAGVRLVGDGEKLCIWMQSKFVVLDMATKTVVGGIEPKKKEEKFVGWASSSTGTHVTLITKTASRYKVDFTVTPLAVDYIKSKASKVGAASQAISDDGSRELLTYHIDELTLYSPRLEPTAGTATYEGQEFHPGLVKLAVSNSILSFAGRNVFAALPRFGRS